VYAAVGVFGAARWGLATKGDVLVNDWLQSDRARGALDAGMALYLSISMAPMAITMRYLLDSALSGGELPRYAPSCDAALAAGGLAAAATVSKVEGTRSKAKSKIAVLSLALEAAGPCSAGRPRRRLWSFVARGGPPRHTPRQLPGDLPRLQRQLSRQLARHDGKRQRAVAQLA
jgi:hypothetical protein